MVTILSDAPHCVGGIIVGEFTTRARPVNSDCAPSSLARAMRSELSAIVTLSCENTGALSVANAKNACSAAYSDEIEAMFT